MLKDVNFIFIDEIKYHLLINIISLYYSYQLNRMLKITLQLNKANIGSYETEFIEISPFFSRCFTPFRRVSFTPKA